MNKEDAHEFEKLLEIIDQLMGPNGCPWDRAQSLVTTRGSLIEEAYEVVEAIDNEDDESLSDELGDLLFNFAFFCKLAEKENRFSLKETLLKIQAKLIIRHPHVFGEKKIHDVKEVLNQWEEIKNVDRESLMDGIPVALPALARAYKMAGKMKKAKYQMPEKRALSFDTEEELGELLWDIAVLAKEKDLHPENALRKEVSGKESAFRTWEKDSKI